MDAFAIDGDVTDERSTARLQFECLAVLVAQSQHNHSMLYHVMLPRSAPLRLVISSIDTREKIRKERSDRFCVCIYTDESIKLC